MLLVGDGGGCFQSINQSINQSISIFTGKSRNCQETNVKIKNKNKKNKRKKSLTTAWSFSICGHESRRFVSLAVVMSREELTF